MPLATIGHTLGHAPWRDILVPLLAAFLGAAIGALVARHLRRQELYTEAAQKLNEYIDEAVAVLNQIDRSQPFDDDRVHKAKQAVNLARFHSRRLERQEVTNRLFVTDFVLYDMLDDQNYNGWHWLFRSIDDVMAALVEFMILPRLWPPDTTLGPCRRLDS